MKKLNKIEKEAEISKMVGGDLRDRYHIYLANADNGRGMDITTGGTRPLKSFEEWLKS